MARCRCAELAIEAVDYIRHRFGTNQVLIVEYGSPERWSRYQGVRRYGLDESKGNEIGVGTAPARRGEDVCDV
jgi:hypothetical protein